MCGITGYFSEEHRFEQELRQMTGLLAHRGPDAEGLWTDKSGYAGLGHRRLSILDLSQAANQPFHSHCGRYTIVYNGEIYNYQSIAKELGIRPKTTCDTEIIVEAFAKLGIKFLENLNGMFSLAIYDSKDNLLWLARDRLGIKPLFYYWDGANFIFGSELKSLVDVVRNFATLEIDHNTLPQFLHLGFIPEPSTIYKKIYKLPAGHFLKLGKGVFDLKPYWELPSLVTKNTYQNESKVKNDLKNLLTDSVKLRMRSDVPFGTFLSGGIDSSLITALAQQQSTQPIKTYSIGFKEPKFNEADYAQKVSQFLGTDHHEFYVSIKSGQDLLEDFFEQFDEPYADTSAIPTMIVSKMARNDVKMVLSGDGGDELFFGYGSHIWSSRLEDPFWRSNHRKISKAMRLFGSRFKRLGELLDYDGKEAQPAHIFSQEQYFYRTGEIAKILKNSQPIDDYQSSNIFARDLIAPERQALFELQYYLRDDLLTKIDRSTMKYSLEARVPLLDHRIVEYAVNIDPQLKLRDGCAKYILKQILYDLVPQKLFDRPKWGFSVPLKNWLRGDLQDLLEDSLNEDTIKSLGFLDSVEIEKLKKRFLNGQDYLFHRIWLIIVLVQWIKRNH